MNVFLRTTLAAGAISAIAAVAFLPSVAAQNGTPTPVPARARPQQTVGSQGPLPEHAKFTAAQSDAGGALFLQNCAFCHGKDAGGGESGPDLTRSKLVSSDKDGEAIGPVIRNGRPEKGMPHFSLSDAEILNLVAFVHSQQDKAMSQTGVRKGVEESDLTTGNAEAGKQYFEGKGGCVSCHSATGDLKGIASKYSGLRLEMQMLYPRDAKAKVTVKTHTGETLTGTLEYQDEFTIGMKDSFGTYHSWPVGAITYKVDEPAEAHVTAMSKYTDDDVHNVLAYIQTLK
jgi:cytochrome c oxidase cbb3-type subunit 3